jgi:ATP-dependent helicase/nuclease subunit B
MTLAANRAALLGWLEQGGLVLTSSARSAQALRSAFDEQQRARGLRAWEPARVLAWTQWTRSLFGGMTLTGAETRLLLNAAQELEAWAQVIAADEDTAALDLPPASVYDLAALARSGLAAASAFRVQDRVRGAAISRDERIFARWSETFRRTCSRRSWLPSAALDQVLTDACLRGALDRAAGLPDGLWLYDVAPTPSQQMFIGALQARGVRIERDEPPRIAQPAMQAWTRCATERDEMEAAARWARRLLEEQSDAGAPASIAIVAPNFDDDRTALEAVLRDVLAPELHDIGTDLSSTPWQFPSGARLTSVPLIAVALDLARWAAGRLPLAAISRLLLSPYLGRLDELDHAAVFDAQVLRSAPLLEAELSLAALARLAKSPHVPEQAELPGWVAAFQDGVRRIDLQRPRGIAEWMEAVRHLARAAGWPGERPLTAAEFAATRAFDSVLDSATTLDALAAEKERRLSFTAPLRMLERLLEQTREQPLATGAPIQVIAPTELAGCAFDAVVFLQATDAQWPPPSRPHPLLGRALQRGAHMPGASSEQAALDARESTAALLARTPYVLFTWAKENSDGRLRPSPLLREFGLHEVFSEQLHLPAPRLLTLAAEEAPDSMTLPALPESVLRGGARLLKSQAACGFLAFAELRLGSKALDQRETGLDDRERGTLLHRVLQTFWNEVKSRDALAAMTPAERERTLLTHIDREFARRPAAAGGWSTAYLGLMRTGLLRLLEEWMQHELARSSFTVVATEQSREEPIGPLRLSLRVDRIDQLSDGGLVLIDYKTGEADIKAWEGARPDEPQLPLYALLPSGSAVQGLAFAQVRAGRHARWAGLQAEAGTFADIAKIADIEERIGAWRIALETLAEDFHSGHASISPKDPTVNCARCAQRLLCRRDAAALLGGLALDEESEGGDEEERWDG